MFRFSELTEELGKKPAILRGKSVTLHGLSGAEVRAIKDAFPRPAAPMQPDPKKPGEWTINEHDPKYRSNAELWLYRRMLVEVMASLRSETKAGRAYPGSAAPAELKTWATEIFDEADAIMTSAEVERLHKELAAIGSDEPAEETAKGN